MAARGRSWSQARPRDLFDEVDGVCQVGVVVMARNPSRFDVIQPAMLISQWGVFTLVSRRRPGSRRRGLSTMRGHLRAKQTVPCVHRRSRALLVVSCAWRAQ